jgi:hypothetical protein
MNVARNRTAPISRQALTVRKDQEEHIYHEGAPAPGLLLRPCPIWNDVARGVDVLAHFRNRFESGEPQALQRSHFVGRRDAICVRVEPDAQLRPDGIGIGDESIVVAAKLT